MSADDRTRPPTMILQWMALALMGFWTLAAVYGWLPHTILVVSGWADLALGISTGLVHIALWLANELPRPRVFYRLGDDTPDDRVQQRHQ